MKALDEALAASGFSDQLRILESIPPKEYPVLLQEIKTHRRRLSQCQSEVNVGSEESKALVLELKPQKNCLTLAELVIWKAKKKLPKYSRIDDEILGSEEVLDFMRRVMPPWLPDLIEEKTTYAYSGEAMDLVLKYVRAELIPPLPLTSRYYRFFLAGIRRHAQERLDHAKKFLCENRDLVERDLNQALHSISMKGAGHLSHLILRRQPEGEADVSLITAVGELCAEGHFDLSDLIKTTLEAMLDTAREFEARGLISAHNDFAPAAGLCLEHQSIYHALLVSPHKAVVKLGIDVIGSFHLLPGFDCEQFIGRVGSVFSQDSNPLQLAGLELVKEVVAAHPGISERVPEAIAAVLLNPNPKVQAAALEVFKSLPVSGRNQIPEAVQPYAGRILPSLASGFAEWMSAEPDEISQPPPEAHKLELGERLQPITSADDLAFVANELLDRDLDPMRFEQFLDGLAKFAPAQRALLAKKFSPLQKRVFNFLMGQNDNDAQYADVLLLASRLIFILGSSSTEAGEFTVAMAKPPGRGSSRDLYSLEPIPTVMEFARSRVDELLAGIRDGRSFPLLALPEFDLGFISPATLLARFAFYKEAGVRPGHFDFIQALARCDLSGLESTCVEVPMAEDEASRVLRFLVSGEVHGSVETPGWWISAARAREPFGDFTSHEQLAVHAGDNLPDWLVAAAYQQPPSGKYGRNSEDCPGWLSRDSPLLPKRRDDLPADRLYPRQHGSLVIRGHTPPCGSDLRWRYSFTPGLLDPVIAQDSTYIHREAWSMNASAVKAGSAVMGELAKRKPPLRFTMQVLLLLALDSGTKAEKEAGIDLFIQASADGRLAPVIPQMSEVFSLLMQGATEPEDGILQLSRLVPSLRQLSTQGALIQMQVRDILLQGLVRPPLSVPKGLPSLLELLLDLVMAHPPERPLDLNQAWGGMLGGKAKSLVGQIAKVGIA